MTSDPLTAVVSEQVLLVAGRLALIWRCPWCGQRQDLAVEPPARGSPPPAPATCRKCTRGFLVCAPGTA